MLKVLIGNADFPVKEVSYKLGCDNFLIPIKKLLAPYASRMWTLLINSEYILVDGDVLQHSCFVLINKVLNKVSL